MAYAALDDVLWRAGRFAGVFSVAGKRPNQTDVLEALDDVTAVIDAEIRSRGYDPAAVSSELQGALKDVAAWAALARTLPQASPGTEAEGLLERADRIVVAAGFPSLSSSSTIDVNAALEALEAGRGGGGPGSSAGSFWDQVQLDPVDLGDDEAFRPTFARGQSL